MSLVNSEIVSTSAHSNGARAHFKYTFSDGRIVDIGPVNIQSVDDAAAKKTELEAAAIQAVKNSDSSIAVGVDSEIAAKGEANIREIARAFIDSAMSNQESWKAYRKLKRFNNFMQIQGWTPAQVRTQLKIDADYWAEIITRWQYLNSNAAAIDAYRDIQLNDPGAN